jgi:hypothetical protein
MRYLVQERIFSPGVDDALIIAIAICIDRIYEDEKREREHHNHGGVFGNL